MENNAYPSIESLWQSAFLSFSHRAVDAFEEKNKRQLDRWRFDDVRQWELDAARSQLRCYTCDHCAIRADGQLLGSYHLVDDTFEWAWFNPNVDQNLKDLSLKVKQFGEQKGFRVLTTGVMLAPAEWANRLVSTAGYIVGADGIYIGQHGVYKYAIGFRHTQKSRWVAQDH